MRIAVTGSAGFLGSHLVDRLLGLGHTVVGFDSLLYGARRNFEHHTSNRRFTFVEADVRDSEALGKACRGADVIVHLAAHKIPRYGGALDTLLVNTEGTRNVLDAARDGQRKVVLASTSDVYGKSPDLPFKEDGDLVLGSSKVKRWAYATSKLFDEHLAFAYMDEYDLPVVALRFFGSYGPRHHLSWWGGPQSVFMSSVMNDEPMTIHGDGQQTRSFTYVSDTVDGIVRATLSHAADGEILNLGNNHEITILELAETIYRLCDAPGRANLEFIPYKTFSGGKYEDVRRRVPDCSKAARLLDWRAHVDLETGLTRTIEWHRAALATATSMTVSGAA